MEYYKYYISTNTILTDTQQTVPYTRIAIALPIAIAIAIAIVITIAVLQSHFSHHQPWSRCDSISQCLCMCVCFCLWPSLADIGLTLD